MSAADRGAGGAETLARTSHAEDAGTGASRLRTRILLVVVLLVFGALVGTSPSPDATYDPRGTGATGLRGVLDTLRSLDVDVTIGTVDDGSAAVVLALPGVDPEIVDRAVRDGRRVVSTLPPVGVDATTTIGLGGLGAVDLPVDCDLLPDVASLASPAWTGWLLPDDSDLRRCVAVGDGWWLAASGAPGQGEHVHLVDLAPLVNGRLLAGDDDAAVAAARLLAPDRGGALVVLEPGRAAARAGLTALVRPRVWDGVALGVLAVLLLAAALGRRLGTPPDERLPVRVPGGELVRALGDLRARADQRTATADALRRHTLAALRSVHGLAPTAGAEEALAAHRAAGLVVPPGAEGALRGGGGSDDEALVGVADALAWLRDEALRAAAAADPNPGAPTPSSDATTAPSDLPDLPDLPDDRTSA